MNDESAQGPTRDSGVADERLDGLEARIGDIEARLGGMETLLRGLVDELRGAPSRSDDGDRVQHRERVIRESPATRTLSPTVRKPASTMLSARQPAREAVGRAIEELGGLVYTREITLFTAAVFGREVPSARFGPLMKDEQQAYRNSIVHGTGRQRDWYLAYGLTYERGEPIKRLWTRSDIPFADRLVGPLTGEVQHLKVTARLCEIAMKGDDGIADPTMLKILAADHARGLPNVRVKRGEFELESWRTAALALLEQLGPEDERHRQEAAAALEDRPEWTLLFGTPDVLPGFADEMRSWGEDRA